MCYFQPRRSALQCLFTRRATLHPFLSIYSRHLPTFSRPPCSIVSVPLPPVSRASANYRSARSARCQQNSKLLNASIFAPFCDSTVTSLSFATARYLLAATSGEYLQHTRPQTPHPQVQDRLAHILPDKRRPSSVCTSPRCFASTGVLIWLECLPCMHPFLTLVVGTTAGTARSTRTRTRPVGLTCWNQADIE
jgi:hypothetical protein